MGSGKETICCAVMVVTAEAVGSCGAERTVVWMSALIEVSTSAECLPSSVLTRGPGC